MGAFVLLLLIGQADPVAAFFMPKNGERFNGYQGVTIDSIIIDNQNIYDVSQPKYDRFLFKTINSLHIKTTKHIIKKEVLLEVGQPFDSTLAAETERNLRRWLNVYDAWVTPQLLGNGNLKVTITTIDQWSLNGGLEYSREGNDKKLRLGLTEKNLAGYNIRFTAYYVDDSREGEYFEGSFSDVRFLGYPVLLSASYNDNPKAKYRAILLEHPFYNLSQNWSASGLVSFSKGRQDYYNNDSLVGLANYSQDLFDGNLTYRFGKRYNKKNVSLLYEYKYEPNTSYGLPAFHSTAAADTAYHQFGLKFEYEKYRFYKGKNYDGIDYTEDIFLGRFFALTYKRAFRTDFESSYYGKYDLQVAYNLMVSKIMFFSQYDLNFWLDGSEQLRRKQIYSFKSYYKPLDFLLFAGRINLTLDKINTGLENLILGGEAGIRGYDTYYQSGQKRLIANLESRIVTPINFWTVRLGGVVFVDAGKIWNHEDNFDFNDFSMSYGVGLRIGFENSTQNIVRLDLVHTDLGDWELSAGTGQYFSLPGS